ncbi:MAG TPA: hypothetical protein VHB50_18545 [Bryobacteraceae bacterium]|jgi:hypothetical protein|nr:hypothetical protein [Bryobacteraceae bacterium]
MRVDNFYTAFGYLACQFAELEADLRALLAGLSFRDDMVTAAVFLDSSQLAENTNALRKLARIYEGYEPQMLEIAKRIEKLRETRNLFIHGIWNPGDFISGGVAIVRDLNCSYEKLPNERRWHRGKGTEHSINSFNELLKEVRAITALIEELCEKLENDDDLEINQFGSVFRGKRPSTRKGDLELLIKA